MATAAGKKVDELLKRPLYVFDIPQEILETLKVRTSSPAEPENQEKVLSKNDSDVANGSSSKEAEDGNDGDGGAAAKSTTTTTTSCALCKSAFQNLAEQRRHFRSDWHGYNLKRKQQHGLPSIDEIEFEAVLEKLDESISGSDSDDSPEENEGATNEKAPGRVRSTMLSQLLERQANLHEGQDGISPEKKGQGFGNSPLLWFSSSLLPSNALLGVYRVLFTNEDLGEPDLVATLRKKQVKPQQQAQSSNKTDVAAAVGSLSGPTFFLCMIGGGHFAGMIVSLAPKVGKRATGGGEERQAVVVAHKTFHRYTTRRKQGGSQSANDSAKGAAHSAGAGIRRYNEAALESEVRALLSEWKGLLDDCQLHFVRAAGVTNRRTLFGPYEGQVLHSRDPRNRSFPFSTRRATQSELMRSFVELTMMKVKVFDETAITAHEPQKQNVKPLPAPSQSSVPPKASKEDEAKLLHTSQLQALIKRSKVPALLSYISANSLSPDFRFHPQDTQIHHHASTPLHLASSINSPILVLSLLTKAGADPTVLNGEGRVSFDLAGDRPTRDAFRVARSILGEDKWDWAKAHCPPAMTKDEADARDAAEQEASQKAESQRRKAETERLEREAQAKTDPKGANSHRKPLAGLDMTAADRREQETRGLTPEMRAKLERERRAKAAEARIAAMTRGR